GETSRPKDDQLQVVGHAGQLPDKPLGVDPRAAPVPGLEPLDEHFHDARLRYTLYVARAQAFHEYRRAWARPRSTISSRRASLLNTREMSSAMASASWAGERRAASPVTSGTEELSDATTGHPQVRASSKGRPNPSYSVGNTKASAAQ